MKDGIGHKDVEQELRQLLQSRRVDVGEQLGTQQLGLSSRQLSEFTRDALGKGHSV